MKAFFIPLVHFVFHIGYFGPLVMGALDSSFLVLPFGNDLVVVGLIARFHHGAPWYVLSAACGSTLGVLLLSLVARKAGEEGLRRVVGDERYQNLREHIRSRAALAIAISGLAPPPFPFTAVIAAVAALQYPLWRVLVLNFFSRGLRFTLLALFALRFGHQVLQFANSPAFQWAMAAFIFLCLIASGVSIARWLRHPRAKTQKKTARRPCGPADAVSQ